MSDLNTKNIKAFIQRCLLERDELLSAVSHDKFEMAYQQQLREWHSGASGGGWCPTGKTVEVCDRFRPQVGYGACHHLYQQANADARESHAAPVLLPMLNAAWNCQVELYGQARVASEQSRKDVACLTQHSEAFCRLIDVVNRDGPNHQKGESRSEKQPSVTSAEAEEVTKRLYHQLEGKTANYWAKEIRSETGKKCSESLVKGLPLWKQHMERKGKSAGGRTVVGLDALGPVMSEAPTPDEQIA
ncbi:MAG: hypothetical protein QGF59_13515, partial [Pirellulaceae bacterium]|nr:hypothetical protein [Pirellulaceae bacterium]